MKCAIVHNWPGQRNSELELIKRIISIAGKLEHECRIIDPLGHPLTIEGEHLERVAFVNLSNYDFCLNLHYVNPNLFDTFSYAVNWNPFDYVVRNPMDGSDLPIDHIAYRTSCLESHDALLSAGSEEMDDFAASLNFIYRQHISDNRLCLHTTSQIDGSIPFPDFKNFRIFYIGANWERQQSVSRHEGLVEKLDATNTVDFYGVSKQHGIFLWEGVKNYKGELPFDGGTSIVEKSNQCGVSLVLHSKAHRRSGLVSTRIFQACAAKTLSICDDNSFIRKHFKDSVLYINYGDDPAQNYQQIMEKVDWIKKYPDKALDMARKAHEIFVEKYSLEKEITHIFQNHDSNVKKYLANFSAGEPLLQVDVLYVHRENEQSVLDSFFDDLKAQIGVCPRGVIFVSKGQAGDIRKTASHLKIKCEVVEWGEENGHSLPLDGRLVARYLAAHAESAWFTLYSKHSRWKKMHLTQLVRAGENKNPVILSGTFVKNKKFSELINEYYHSSMDSIGGHPRGITESDIGVFNAAAFSCSSILFSTSLFQEPSLFRPLRFFDKGWAFFLITWYYVHTHKLPFFVPKLTTQFCREDEKWQVDSYINSMQTEDFERSLVYAVFKNNPYFLSAWQMNQVAGLNISKNISSRFSANLYLQNVLASRPILLKIYKKVFRAVCFFFRFSL